MSNSNSENSHRDDWEACPSNQILEMVKELNLQEKRARNTRLLGRAAIAGLLLLAIGGTYQWAADRGNGSPNIMVAGIDCNECRTMLVEFHKKVSTGTSALSPEQFAQVKGHVIGCKHCNAKYESMHPGELATLASLIQTYPASVVNTYPTMLLAIASW